MVEDAQRQQYEPQHADGHEATGDPNPRGLDDVWEFGVAASAAMAERVQELYRLLPAGGVGAGDLDAELRRLRVDIERGADVMLDLFDRALALVRRIDRDATAERGAGEELVIAVAAGRCGATEAWAHNVSGVEQPSPQLRCGPLTNWDGLALPDASVRVECSARPIEGRNSRCIQLVVEVPLDTAPGSYRGLLIARDDPDVAIRVRVDVTPP